MTALPEQRPALDRATSDSSSGDIGGDPYIRRMGRSFIVALYGAIGGGSPAAGQADPAFSPSDDVLGRARDASPDLGAYEAGASSTPAIAPASGPSAGGTGVAVTGSGFQSGASVEIGGAAATGESVSSASFLTA